MTLNPVLNVFDVVKRFGAESQLWLVTQSLFPALTDSTTNPFLQTFGLYLYDPSEGLMKQQFFCSGAEPAKAGLAGLPGMPGGKGGGMESSAGAGMQGQGMAAGGMGKAMGGLGEGETPFGVPTGQAKEKNCNKGGGSASAALVGAALQGECMGFDSFMNTLLNPASHGMGTCSLWSTAASGKGCDDLCGGSEGGGGAAGACGVGLPQLGWVMCHRDPFTNPIAPNPQPFRGGSGEGQGGNTGIGGAGSQVIESIVSVPVGTLCGSASTGDPSETPIKTPLDEKIDKNKAQAAAGFGKIADALRNQANANGHNISPEQHAAAQAHATAAMAKATPVNFQKVSPEEVAKQGKQKGSTPLVGGQAVLSPDGGTVYHSSGKPGQPSPGGLYDPDSERIFLNKGVAASGQGAGVAQHEGGHAYLSAAGVASKEHHSTMGESGAVPMSHGNHLCQGDTCSNQCTSAAGQFAPPGGCQGYPQGPKPNQPDCIVAECMNPNGNPMANTEGDATATAGTKKGGEAGKGGGLSACAPGTSSNSACWAVDCAPTMGSSSPLANTDTNTAKGGSVGSGTSQCCSKQGGDPILGLDWSNLNGFGLWDPSPMMRSFLEHASTPTETLPQRAQPQRAAPLP